MLRTRYEQEFQPVIVCMCVMYMMTQYGYEVILRTRYEQEFQPVIVCICAMYTLVKLKYCLVF